MIKVAAIQYKPPKGDIVKARYEIVALIKEALSLGAKLVVCPEMATSGYVWQNPDDLFPFSEDKQGETAQVLRKLAKSNDATIICGYPEKEAKRLYNSALICSPWGDVYSYRKILLYDADLPWASPGSKRMILQTSNGTVFPAICMDINDPRMRQAINHNQPDFLAFCTNWIDEGEPVLPYWKMMLHAYKGIFIAANTYGEDNGTRFSGKSVILGPNGVIFAEAPYAGDCVISADVEALNVPK